MPWRFHARYMYHVFYQNLITAVHNSRKIADHKYMSTCIAHIAHMHRSWHRVIKVIIMPFVIL